MTDYNAYHDFLKDAANIFDETEKYVLDKLEDQHISEEDHITSYTFASLESDFNRLKSKSYRVISKQTGGRGKNSEESLSGADGVLIFDNKAVTRPYSKYYLFQSKKDLSFRSGYRFDDHAVEQAYKMLTITSDSFFLIQTRKGMFLVSAYLVSKGISWTELNPMKFTEFNMNFLKSFIGDHKVVNPYVNLPFPEKQLSIVLGATY